MSYDELKFKGTWFKEQETKLSAAAYDLDCVSKKIGAVQYSWGESYRFAPFKEAFATMVAALTTGPEGSDDGVELMDDMREAVVTTGRAYLRTEAANEGLAAQIEQLITDLDL